MISTKEPDVLAGITERDWAIVLKQFDTAQSNRREPGHYGLKVL